MRVSFSTEDEVRIWFVYTLEDDKQGEGVEEDPDADWVGEVPDWLECERENVGWTELVRNASGCDEHNFLEWGLLMGIAPGQPFLVRFGQPHYYETNTPDGHDWDVEYDGEIVMVESIDPAKAAARWDKAISEDIAANEAMVLHQQMQEHQRRHNLDKMRLRQEWFFAPGQHYWDSPSAIHLTLTGQADDPQAWRIPLAHGRDNGGDFHKALNRLVEEAGLTLPHISPDFIRKLPVSSY